MFQDFHIVINKVSNFIIANLIVLENVILCNHHN